MEEAQGGKVTTMEERFALMYEAMCAFNEPEIDPHLVRYFFAELDKQNLEAARDGFQYWRKVFDEADKSTTREQIKDITREHICKNHAFSRPKFNLVQGAMKAAIHRLWRRLYYIECERWSSDLKKALLDATTFPLERSTQYMRQIYEEIAAETGETVEQLMFRICPE